MKAALFQTVKTPDGPFTLIVGTWFAGGGVLPDGQRYIVGIEGMVIASGWTDDLDWLRAHTYPSARPEWVLPGKSDYVTAAVEAVEAYYAGDLAAIRTIPTAGPETTFQTEVHDQLRNVPAGTTVSYSELAARAGNPAAARAAAAVCSHNAVALFCPCHRVVRADGGLGGFLYGLDLKRRLLDREGADYRV